MGRARFFSYLFFERDFEGKIAILGGFPTELKPKLDGLYTGLYNGECPKIFVLD